MEYHKRGFLNLVHGTAAFECHVDHVKGNECYNSVCANFTISDCARKIELDFYAYDKKSQDNNLHKLNTLVTELQEFKNKLLEAYSDAACKDKE